MPFVLVDWDELTSRARWMSQMSLPGPPSPVAEPAVTRRLVQSSPRYGALSHKEASNSIGSSPEGYVAEND